jgi:hypothetical protein
VLEQFGFSGRWGYHAPSGEWFGMSERDVDRLCREADACLNVTGAHALRDAHMRIPRRLYVESDPFATQVRVAKGDERTIAFLDAHTHFFTFGESVGRPGCGVPVARYQWRPTCQPVLLSLWHTAGNGGSAYTTVTTWHNKGEGIEWGGDRYYWTKDREFQKFLDVPRRRAATFEMAVSVEEPVRTLLARNGWRNTGAVGISSDINRYREYIQRSRAEFTVARDQYVRPRTGWFSDRSVCYLAAGRPVITQATGFEDHIPTGHGLFAFHTMDDILAAIDAIEADYKAHCEAAREVAAMHFGSDRVLADLLRGAGL